MSDNLETFAHAYKELQETRNGFTPIKERWYAWNYWAQHQASFSYSRWMIEHNVMFEDTKAKAQHPNADVRYDREEGYRYLSAWRGAQTALIHAEEKFDLFFRKMWEAQTIDGQPTYSNEELGEAIGKDAEQLRKFALKKPWYYPRNTKIGTK